MCLCLCVCLLRDCGRDDVPLGVSSAFREGRSQDDAPMLTELNSDWVAQVLSEEGPALQKLANEHKLVLGPDRKTQTKQVYANTKHTRTYVAQMVKKTIV